MDHPKTHKVAAGSNGWRIMLRVVGLLGWLLTWPALAQTTLQINSSNGVVTAAWPLTAYEDILQTTTDLSPAGTWTNLVTGDPIIAAFTFLANGGSATPTYAIGNQWIFSRPATNRQQFFRLSAAKYIPISSFAIFYNGTLEFSYCAPLVINGRVHANGPIYVGTISGSSLTFNAPVTTTTDVAAPNLDGATTANWNPAMPSTWHVTFNNYVITNFPNLGFSPSDTNNYHSMIEIPPAGEDPASTNSPLRLYNEAQMILTVTNSPFAIIVKLILQASYNGQLPGADPSPIVLYYTNGLTADLPFLNLTNKTYDARESKTNVFTQIDVGRFAIWAATNPLVQGKLPAAAGVYPTILYVAECRYVSTKQLASVRLVNGAQLPANGGYGFSVATPNPLYVQGNYNTQTSAGSSTGTNNAYEVPAALLSDALTILSPSWSDSQSYTTFSSSSTADAASTMTINAAIVTGTVPSTGTGTTTYSGGIHNLPRLLEDWIGVNLYLNTSIIRLWDSQMATNQWKYQGTYYLPPNRYFSFDNNYLNPAKVPPGIPAVQVVP